MSEHLLHNNKIVYVIKDNFFNFLWMAEDS